MYAKKKPNRGLIPTSCLQSKSPSDDYASADQSRRPDRSGMVRWHLANRHHNRQEFNRWLLPVIVVLLWRLWSGYRNVPADVVRYYQLQKSSEKVSAAGCLLRTLDPFDPSIQQFVSSPAALHCKQVQPSLSYLDNVGRLWLNHTEARLAGYNDLVCSARCFDHNEGVDDDTLLFGPWTSFNASLSLGCDFVEVSCIRPLLRISFYSYHHMNITDQKLPLVIDTPTSVPADDADRLSVLVFGLDSMSRSNMIRQLPLTVSYLKKNLNGVVFDGHSKIGDNTWVNWLAMLSGKRSVPSDEYPADLSQVEERFFDDYADYIWRKFSQNGYYTLFSEDRPDIHTFNYGIRKGFIRRPTNFYDRPFWLASWSSFVRKRSTGFCYNTVPEHQIQFDWVRRFITQYEQRATFGFFWWQALSHDFLNTIGLADGDTVRFLQDIEPHLNNTLLIVISDHGHRYDAIRQSVIGRLEARLPFLAVVTPKWFDKKYPKAVENLRLNAAHRLTTQYDIYATFLDIIERTFDVEKTPASTLTPPYSVSLFRSIPAERTCKDGHIPQEYCPCYTEIPVAIDEPMVRQAAEVLVQRVNSLLSRHRPLCAVLRLELVQQAFIVLPHQATVYDPQVGRRAPSGGFHANYRVQVRTEPGQALLEGVVKHFADDGSLRLDGDIDRNNAYGNTSACITDSTLRKYCFCGK